MRYASSANLFLMLKLNYRYKSITKNVFKQIISTKSASHT